MRIELINPNNPTNAANVPFLQKGLFSRDAKAYSPPLALCMVAAYTPEHIEVSITDECVKPVDFSKDVDLVGLTGFTNNAPRAYEIADTFRERGVRVVMGGIHASNLPEEALKHCDTVVVGEGEGTWQRLIRDFSQDRLAKIYQNERLVSLENLPIPRRDLLSAKDYVTINTIQTTRGCPHNCSFCSVTGFNGKTYRFRPIRDVVREIETLPSRNVFIIDDNIFGHRERTRELFKALVPLGIRWGSQCTISIAHDPEMLELAAKSGCIGLAIGLESFCKGSLDGANKHFNDPKTFYQDIQTIKGYGILTWGSFVMGFDEDRERDLDRTVQMAKASRLDFACFNFLTPLPGTRVYETLQREGRITSKNWADYNMAHLVFRPFGVTGWVLESKVKKAWLEFYSLRAVIRRLGVGFGKTRFFVWLVNLALCFYTRKRLKWN